MQELAEQVGGPGKQGRGRDDKVFVAKTARKQDPGRADGGTDKGAADGQHEKAADRLARAEGPGDAGGNRETKEH
ncbi:hypothetical protein D9M68_426530 [compost metagenome]